MVSVLATGCPIALQGCSYDKSVNNQILKQKASPFKTYGFRSKICFFNKSEQHNVVADPSSACCFHVDWLSHATMSVPLRWSSNQTRLNFHTVPTKLEFEQLSCFAGAMRIARNGPLDGAPCRAARVAHSRRVSADSDAKRPCLCVHHLFETLASIYNKSN